LSRHEPDRPPSDLSLLLLRLGVGLAMAMWTADKFVNPAHGSAIMQNLYGLPAFSAECSSPSGWSRR